MPKPLLTLLVCVCASSAAAQPRPTVGVAFGGGSARGIAHVGVIRWFEEHRIPIDVAAGTSMGGLIGGAYATGMDAAELDDMVQHLNWDELFGGSNFAFRNIRRKWDARAYPARLEFGLSRGIVPPTSLNNGQQVDLLLARIAAAYYDIESFDQLPTPFRAVAVDLLSATEVVMDRGSLATAMRASTRASIAKADIIIDVPLAAFGSLDWRRSAELVVAGYNAAEAMRATLLPLSIGEADYAAWTQARQARRRRVLPVPAFVFVDGFSGSDQRRLSALLARHVGVAFDLALFQMDLAELSGLDRYEAITWRFTTNAADARGLLVQARPKPYGPPFLMLGLNLENTTSDEFRLALTGRYLAYDRIGSGSELRLDGTLGSGAA